MARKKDYSAEYEQIVDNTKIIPTDLESEMKKSFIAYAMAVNISRAIPDARDGLKPVHRRILYAMNESGLTYDKPYKKCATTVGDVLGRYHPHGDSSVYGALVRLAQDFSIRYPLVDGHGNFGSVDGDPPAAYRYTESRLSKLANEMLRDIDKETVDFVPNFDETRKQPTVLPSRFPNLLVNGSDGIAVGMATNIPPHNLNEVCDAIIAQIKNPEITIDELMEIIPAPDYPTGGVVMGKAALRNAYLTGRGGVVVRGRCEIEQTEKHNRIIIDEIPYQVNKSELIISMADLVKNKRIEGIADIKDESDRKGMRIVIDVKKDAQPQVVLNYLYKHTALQTGFGINFLALVDGQPKTLNLKQLLAVYIDHQKDVVIRKTKYDLARAQERAHILEGLVVALANIDDVIATIKASKDRADANTKLMEQYLLSDIQANAILDMKLQRLTSLEVEKLNEELKNIVDLIAELKGIIASEQKVLDIIIADLTDIKERFGDERRSEICQDLSEIDIEDLIEREDVVISMTHFGYIKRLPVAEYKSQHRGGQGVTGHKAKEEDFDFDAIMEGKDWFHFSGITPALSDSMAKLTEKALIAAKKHNVTVSCDLNFRKKLWSKEEANKTMTEVCKYVDVCIANEEDASDVFGIKATDTDINTGKLSAKGYEDVCHQLVDKFGFKKVAITLRESISASDNNWSAMLYSDGKFYTSKKYSMRIVDRVGGGDSFGGGLIAAILKGYDDQQVIELAVAASCLKHSIEGDYNLVSWNEVETLANGNGSGRVQR